jgi:DNA-binding PadR family transcriptional regulator
VLLAHGATSESWVLTTSRCDVSCTVVMSADLSQRGVLVLTSLAGGSKHGYALIKDIEQFADVTLGPGTLYGVLARLEESGLIKALPADKRRHPYQITAAGTSALTDQLQRDHAIARVGLARVGVQPA